jgi:hypothetical protein
MRWIIQGLNLGMWHQIYPFSETAMALRPTQPPVQWVMGGGLPEGKATRALVQNVLFCNLLSKNIKHKIYITITLPVLYGCEIWCLILREQHTPKVFNNTVLGMIFGSEEEVTTDWRKLHN